MTSNEYWILTNLDGKTALRTAELAGGVDRIEINLKSGDTKFWPGSPKLFANLFKNLPNDSMIHRQETEGYGYNDYKLPINHVDADVQTGLWTVTTITDDVLGAYDTKEDAYAVVQLVSSLEPSVCCCICAPGSIEKGVSVFSTLVNKKSE